jgi:hypothetical protein
VPSEFQSAPRLGKLKTFYSGVNEVVEGGISGNLVNKFENAAFLFEFFCSVCRR